MRLTSPSAFLALAMASGASAQIAKACQGQVCYSVNIPDATAQSGSGDVYFQITGPSSNSWIALGQGSGMSGSNMFVVYASSSGENVTVSPRLGRGHFMPTFNGDAEVSVLEGSGVSNGVLTANVRCSNCNSWNGGSMDFTGDSGRFVWATRSGSAMNTDDQSAVIQQHGSMGGMEFKFSQARGGNSLNPFVSSSSSGSGSSSGTGTSSGSAGGASNSAAPSCRPRPSAAGNSGSNGAVASMPASSGEGSGSSQGQTSPSHPTSYPGVGPGSHHGHQKRALEERDDLPYCDETGSGVSDGSSNGGSAMFGSAWPQRNLLIAHGVLGCLAFGLLFPIGAIIIRVLSFSGLVWVHAAFQVVSWFLFIACFGLGVYVATSGPITLMGTYHTTIGVVLFVLLLLQPIGGLMHHRMFKKRGTRTFWSYGHIWLGRILLTLGIINGGLGFKLAANTRTGYIVYAVVAGIVWLLYVAAIVYGERKRAKNAPQKYENRSPPRSQDTQEGFDGPTKAR